jgi:hypothetical protein
MEIDKVVIIMIAVFGFLGAMVLLTFSANAIKLYYHEVELVKLDEEFQEKIRKQLEAKNNPTDNNPQKDDPIEVS